MWENAVHSIQNEIYRKNTCNFLNTGTKTLSFGFSSPKKTFLEPKHEPEITILTAYEPYNEAFLNPKDAVTRNRLFASYEQMENKN